MCIRGRGLDDEGLPPELLQFALSLLEDAARDTSRESRDTTRESRDTSPKSVGETSRNHPQDT
ncbi:hypothetical protein EF908_20855, partial [Streptomyces sp. WAC04770]